MTDKRMISKKIKLMEKDLEHLQGVSKYSFTEITKDEYLYLSLERLLERVVNRAIDINSHIIIEDLPMIIIVPFIKWRKLKFFPENLWKRSLPRPALETVWSANTMI